MPGALSVIKAIASEVDSNNLNSVFHIGDISYATGFLAEWDFFMNLISPVASRVSYMTAIGNHERDYVSSGSVYQTPDSGGECGVPYETYFPMPTSAKDKPWYSIEQASVHFTVISTEHDWSINSQQYEWMKKDMASVNRQHTPWLVFMGRLVEKYGADFQRMMMDIKLNPMQHSGATLEKLCMSYYIYKNKNPLIVLAYDAKNLKALYRRGQAYKERGLLQDAVTDLSNALEVSPDDDIIGELLWDTKEQLIKEGGHCAPGRLVIEEITKEVENVPSGNNRNSSTEQTIDQPKKSGDSSKSYNIANNGNLKSNSDSIDTLKKDPEAIRSFQNFISKADPATLAYLNIGQSQDVSPDMIKASSDMIGKMSP
ncbi:hypothetical protein RYX36_027339 [Vicia faba]